MYVLCAFVILNKDYLLTYLLMNGGAKCRKWSSLGRLRVTQGHQQSPFDRAHTTSYSTLIETMCLSWNGF